LAVHHKVGDIFTDNLSFVQYAVLLLLCMIDAAQPELHAQRVFIDLFVQPMPKHIQINSRPLASIRGFISAFADSP
jgi:hypothetical protein